MYNVVNDAGNVYVYDEDENLVNYKDKEIMQAIFADNSIVSGEDTETVQDIVDYINNNYVEEQADIVPDLPYYLTQEEIDKTKLTE